MTPSTGTDLNWLLDDLVGRIKETEHAIVLSSDGLLMASSAGLQRTDGEHLSAVASGLQSLAKGVSDHISGGEVRQTVVEWKNQFLIVTTAGERACLAVLCAQNADIGLVAYEMAMLVARVGQYLTSGARNAEAIARSDR
ncbi:roadblock/LC7 domain-containing protein [Nonomuraea fuscirosea]|jgi:predicted regulator of Ras-like GTPase activity (Roadblock/LC7/MglB family)|uniref:Putative regulator of Ras-like GTPase activity (Roadblock/LC7/MglB family) n=1 Tax=Nonomuraea fuscirosea TaxID=1291556 RepID=A0A2T0NBV2_9ACTN|nr:roadblock/LC7 domain-containing protein [Nonomuraea fuscirosea]PRX70484.1 putative regulator of Ras-like GTPase activity (Roadblock/LC7/MglB family) [Nonomuraea fuscirosea]